METYTFVVEFRGGTYCSQVQAKNMTQALKKWLVKFRADKNEITYLGDKIFPQLEKDLLDNDSKPQKLNGLKNIWFTCFTTRQGFITMNIILTNANDI